MVFIYIYIFPHYVCTCVFMHTNTLESEVSFGMYVSLSRTLDCPWKEGVLHPGFIHPNNKFEENVLYFNCSHLDCLKLPHAKKKKKNQKQSENVVLKSERTQNVEWIWGWTAIFALELLSLSEGATSSRSQVFNIVFQCPPPYPPYPHPTPSPLSAPPTDSH